MKSSFLTPIIREMIYSLSGELKKKTGRYVVIGIGGVNFGVTIPVSSEPKLPKLGEEITVFIFMHVREGGIDLYGFLEEEERSFFELLVSVSGIGPKSAMSVLGVAPVERLVAAVSSGQPELLQKSSGIGRKTADRIVLELKDKVSLEGNVKTVEIMQSDNDVYEALVNLGYSRRTAKDVLGKIDESLNSTSERLRDALNKIKN